MEFNDNGTGVVSPLEDVPVSRRRVVKIALAASAVAVPLISSVVLGGASAAFAESPNLSGKTTAPGAKGTTPGRGATTTTDTAIPGAETTAPGSRATTTVSPTTTNIRGDITPTQRPTETLAPTPSYTGRIPVTPTPTTDYRNPSRSPTSSPARER